MKSKAPFLSFLLIPGILTGGLLAQSSQFAQPGKTPQNPDSRLAVSYEGGGVTWNDFYLEISRRYRGRDFAKKGLAHIIQARIVAIESKKRGFEADMVAVEARIQLVRTQLAQSKKTLEDHLRGRRMTLARFRALVELSINTEALVRTDLGLDAKTRVPAHKIQLWMSEKRKEHKVVTDPEKLPFDICARIEGKDIPLLRLGESMSRILASQDKKRILREMAAYRLLQAKAKELDLGIVKGDIEEQLELRRKDFESRPQFADQNIKLEALLRSEGRTIKDLTHGEVFRTNLLVRKIGDRLYPMEQIKSDFKQDPKYWQDRLGPTRRVFRLWVQGPPKRTKADATILLGEIAKKIQNQQNFQAMARQFSEDKNSKKLDGNLGFLHRIEPRYPEALLAGAFARPIGTFLPKIVEESGGYTLLMVTQEKPGPQGEALWKAIRRHKMTTLLAKLIEERKLLYHDGS